MRNMLLASAAAPALLYALPAEAQTCTAAPDCATLGYTKTAVQCSGKTYTRCPFDTSKYNCDNDTSSSDCTAAGFIDSPKNCPNNYVACPGNTSHVRCLQGAKVGDLKYSLRTSDHDGWLLCNGGTYNHKEYPELYAVIGDLFGTKRPNYVGYFLRGVATSSKSTFKTPQEAGLPNITAQINGLRNEGINVSGAISMKYRSANGAHKDSGNMYDFTFDASKSNPIYGKSTTVTPQNYPANIFIYAGRRVSSSTVDGCENSGYQSTKPDGYTCQEKTVGSTKCYTNCRPESVLEQCRKKYKDIAYGSEQDQYPNSTGWCYSPYYDDCGKGAFQYSADEISDIICKEYEGELIRSCDIDTSCLSSDYGISI